MHTIKRLSGYKKSWTMRQTQKLAQPMASLDHGNLICDIFSQNIILSAICHPELAKDLIMYGSIDPSLRRSKSPSPRKREQDS